MKKWTFSRFLLTVWFMLICCGSVSAAQISGVRAAKSDPAPALRPDCPAAGRMNPAETQNKTHSFHGWVLLNSCALVYP